MNLTVLNKQRLNHQEQLDHRLKKSSRAPYGQAANIKPNKSDYKSAKLNFQGGFSGLKEQFRFSNLKERFNNLGPMAKEKIEKVGEKAAGSETFATAMKTADNNAILFDSIYALFLTCALRPVANFFIPGAKKRDKDYASAQSIASGLVKFGIAFAGFKQLNNAFERFSQRVKFSNLDDGLRGSNQYDELRKKPFAQAVTELGEQCRNNTDPFHHRIANLISDEVEAQKGTPFGERMKGFKIDYDVDDSVVAQINKHIEDEHGGDCDHIKRIKEEQGYKDFITKLEKIEEAKKCALNLDFNLGNDSRFKKYKKFLPKGIKEMNFGEVLDAAQSKTFDYLKHGKVLEKFKYNFSSYSPKFIEIIVSSYITILAIPPLIKLIFPNKTKKVLDKTNEDRKPTDKAKNIPLDITVLNSAALTHNGKPKNNKPASISFGAKPPIFKEGVVQKFFNRLAGTQIAEKWSKVDNLNKRRSRDNQISAGLGTLTYLVATSRNKDIEKENKPALLANLAIVYVLSTLVGMVLNKRMDKVTNIFEKAVQKTFKTARQASGKYNPAERDSVMSGMKNAKGMLIFQLIYRFAGPVLATPLAAFVIKNFYDAHKAQKAQEAQQTAKTQKLNVQK